MNFYDLAPLLKDKIETKIAINAKPTSWLYVIDMNIIEVQYANYHNAVLTGHFILASNPPAKFMKNGYRKAVIVCTWFG